MQRHKILTNMITLGDGLSLRHANIRSVYTTGLQYTTAMSI